MNKITVRNSKLGLSVQLAFCCLPEFVTDAQLRRVRAGLQFGRDGSAGVLGESGPQEFKLCQVGKRFLVLRGES